MNDALPPRDHNEPPNALIERVTELVKACNEGIAATPVIKEPETAGRVQAFIAQLRKAKDDIDEAVKVERAPHDAAIAVIRTRYADSLALVELARSKVQPLVDNWLLHLKRKADDEAAHRRELADKAQADADEQRRRAERAGATVEDQLRAQRAQEAADDWRALADKGPERPAIKGEFAPRAMSLRTTWTARIIDEDKALDLYGTHPEVRAAALAAILKLCRRMATTFKGNLEAPDGIEFIKIEKAQ